MPRPEHRAYDYVVVGGGAAGCVLAARLSEDPACRVLVLEAGPGRRPPTVSVPAAYPMLFEGRRDWNYTTVPQPRLAGRQLRWPRGRMLGGSTAMNDLVYVRGNRADYDGWAGRGLPGWSYAEVLPYFRRSEDQQRGADAYHGVGGPLAVSDHGELHPRTRDFLAAAATAGLPANDDVNGPVQDGVGRHQITARRGVRWDAARAFLDPVRQRPNLVVITGALAEQVVLQRGRAVGVRWRRGGRQVETRAEREVLLCGGTINSAQLLMLSGIGPAAQLRAAGVVPAHDRPGVGAHLQDHLMVPISWLSREPTSLLDSRTPGAVRDYLRGRRGPLASNFGQAGGFVRSRSGLPAPDLQLVFAPVLLGEVRDRGMVQPTEHGFALGVALLQPASRGSIRLRGPDPSLAPEIRPGYLSAPEDLETLVRGLELADTIGRQPALRRAQLRRSTPTTDRPDWADHVRTRADTMFHPVGTCRMGYDNLAVVDAELRVHGLEGLRVVDASVMPTITRGNTSAPVTMIAERAVDLIRRGRQPGPAGTPLVRGAGAAAGR